MDLSKTGAQKQMSNMKRVSVIFPYKAHDDAVFAGLYETLLRALDPKCELADSRGRPLLVVNEDTRRKGHFQEFEAYTEKRGGLPFKDLEILNVWSVDTCQMWLAGFGHILDKEEAEGDESQNGGTIVQIPGDLRHVAHRSNFYDYMGALSAKVTQGFFDFVVGDFELEAYDAKNLIDAYGTYPLLFNWFPMQASFLWHDLHLTRPRSEFFAASLRFLSHMLRKKKFAYEQTIAFLIHALCDTDRKPPWRIGRFGLGELSDSDEGRRFREVADQIERTERLLRVLWRDNHGGNELKLEKYEELDRRSTAIRQTAMVYLQNVLTARDT